MKLLALLCTASAFAQTPDWPQVNAEMLRHFTAVVRMDTMGGNETRVVEYLKKALEAEGIPVIVSAKDPKERGVLPRMQQIKGASVA